MKANSEGPNTVQEKTQDDFGNTPACEAAPVPNEPSKKRKKKKKRSNKANASTNCQSPGVPEQVNGEAMEISLPVQPVLKISRNKHMKYISTYHGPWLQLPVELLASLQELNGSDSDFHASSSSSTRGHAYDFLKPEGGGSGKSNRLIRELARADPMIKAPPSPPPSPHSSGHSQNGNGEFHSHHPPPVDPCVFRAIIDIRRLVDEATDFTVRASQGASIGMGRSSHISHGRQNRLRQLAVNRLAQAYKIDEIASSVAVMQGASALDDLAWMVLKHDSTNVDAKYVHFFHEKIPSQTLSASTDPKVLEALIHQHPDRLEYYRTLGIVCGFRLEYRAALRNFTRALVSAKALRSSSKHRLKDHSRAGGGGGDTCGDHLEYFERQLLFLRGMTYLHYGQSLVEDAIMKTEGVVPPKGGLSNEGGEVPLETLGIPFDVEALGKGLGSGPKAAAYKEAFSEPMRKKVSTLLRKSVKDHERFVASFPVTEVPPGSVYEGDKRLHPSYSTDRFPTYRGRRLIGYRSMSGRTKHEAGRSDGLNAQSTLLCSYNPLIIESYFTILMCKLLLGSFQSLMSYHSRVMKIMDNLESHPVFLPARSLVQSQYAELLERLAHVWLPERVKATGQAVPPGSENDILRDGGSNCLQYLLSFFTKDYTDLLANMAEVAEKEQEEEAKVKASSNAPFGLLDLPSRREHRPLPPNNHRNGSSAHGHAFRPARTEFALAYMLKVVLVSPDSESVFSEEED